MLPLCISCLPIWIETVVDCLFVQLQRLHKCLDIEANLLLLSNSVSVETVTPHIGPGLCLLCICRPFLLPCLAAGVLSFMASLASMFLLKETLPSKIANNYSLLTQDAEQGMKANSNSPAAQKGDAHSVHKCFLPCKALFRKLSAAVNIRLNMALMPYQQHGSNSLLGVSPHTSHSYTCCQTVLWHAGIEMSTQYSSLQVEDSAADLNSDCNLRTVKQATEVNCNLLCDALQQTPGQGTPAELAGVPYEHHLVERSSMYGVHSSEANITRSREHAADDLADAADPAKPDDEQTLLVSVHNDKSREHASSATANSSKDSSAVWYKERAVQLTVTGYELIAFIYNTADELTPLFAAASPAVGGAGLLANQLAVPLGFCGIVLMLYAVLGYPKCLERYGAAMSCRIGFLATAPLILVTPVLTTCPILL